MGSVNKAILVGNLGRDAEMRFTASGTAVCTVGLATTEKFTDRDGQRREETQWHTVVIWGKTAQSVHEYLTKGKQIYVEGKLKTREWEKDGVKRKATEVHADRVVLLGGGERRARGEAGETQYREPVDGEPVDAPGDSDIPFAWLLPFVLPLAAAMGVMYA